MVAAQCDHKDPDLLGIGRALHVAPVITDLPSPASGIITRADAATIGQAVLALGAGRSRADDSIDPTVGIDHLRKTGSPIKTGEPLCRIHARSRADADSAASTLATAFSITA
jgi:thymidine phosphorylase